MGRKDKKATFNEMMKSVFLLIGCRTIVTFLVRYLPQFWDRNLHITVVPSHPKTFLLGIVHATDFSVKRNLLWIRSRNPRWYLLDFCHGLSLYMWRISQQFWNKDQPHSKRIICVLSTQHCFQCRIHVDKGQVTFFLHCTKLICASGRGKVWYKWDTDSWQNAHGFCHWILLCEQGLRLK